MSKNLKSLCDSLSNDIKKSYESSVTIEEAEKLAAKFLGAQLEVADHLRNLDLDARMRKSGVKALKAAVYLDEVSKNEKKPSDVLLNATVDSSKLVNDEQRSLDEAEVERDLYQNYFNIFKEAHIFFRQRMN